MADLSGRVAIVTGGGQGIGRGVALALASAGASMVIAGRTKSTIDDVCREVRLRGVDAEAIVCDVRELDATEQLVGQAVQRMGRLDILVNNAQTYSHAMLLDATEDDMALTWQSGHLQCSA